jgi:hypothetical protein
MELNSWLQSIAQRRWPILPDTLTDLRQACARNSDLIDFTDLANLVLSDPFLLFDLIRVIGGSRSLQRNESMPSIEQAMMLIGLETVVNRFIKLTPLEPIPGRLHPAVIEDISMWLGHGRVAAAIVKDWLSIAGEHKFEDCYIGALIYNLPACFYLVYSNHTSGRPLLQEVSETFHTPYPKVLEQFVWNMPLPTGLLTVLSSEGGNSKRKQLLRLAVATANGLIQGAWRPQWWVGIEAAARLLGVSASEAYRVVPQAVLHVARNPRAMAYTYPVREFMMLPGSFDVPAMHPVSAQDAGGKMEQAMRDAVRHMVSELGFARVVFLRYDAERHCLKLRYQYGLPEQHPLRTSPVGLEPGSFFALLTSKSQSYRASAHARQQISSSYQDPFFKMLDGGEFVAMTLFAGHHLQGVFYADLGAQTTPVIPANYQHFKELVMSLAKLHSTETEHHDAQH